MNMQERLRALVEPIVTDLGLELFDLEYSGATLTVTIERSPVPGRPRRECGNGCSGNHFRTHRAPAAPRAGGQGPQARAVSAAHRASWPTSAA